MSSSEILVGVGVASMPTTFDGWEGLKGLQYGQEAQKVVIIEQIFDVLEGCKKDNTLVVDA